MTVVTIQVGIMVMSRIGEKKDTKKATRLAESMHMTASLLLCPAQIHKSKKGAKVGSPPLELDPCILQHICAFMHLSFHTIICIIDIGKILNRGTTSSQSSWNVTIF